MQDWLVRIRDYAATAEGRQTLFLIGGAVLAVLILLALLRRWRARDKVHPTADLLEDLSTYPPQPPLPPNAKPLTLYGLPVRMRLVVLAPLGLDAGTITAPEVNHLMNLAVPGLGDRLGLDLPKIRFWPTQLSHQGFVASLRRNTQFPATKPHLRHHVLVIGKVLRDGNPIAIGLALQSTEPNTLGPVVLNYPHQWMEIMRFQYANS
jgi:hypothetical protein